MCVMSMVYDHYRPIIPNVAWPQQPGVVVSDWDPLAWVKILKDFEEAKKAAAIVDDLTGQKDCVDAEKKKLDERAAALAKMLDEAPTVVVEQPVTLEPGTYRLLGGKLLKAVT